MFCSLVLLVTHGTQAKRNLASKQVYLFEVELVDTTREAPRKGYYIDRTGKLYSYSFNRPQQWHDLLRTSCRTRLTNECLKRKYSANKKLVRMLEPSTVQNKLSLSKFIPVQQTPARYAKCSHTKKTLFSVYTYDPRHKIYHKTALTSIDHDDQKSQYAVLLVKWLSSVTGVKVSYFCGV